MYFIAVDSGCYVLSGLAKFGLSGARGAHFVLEHDTDFVVCSSVLLDLLRISTTGRIRLMVFAGNIVQSSDTAREYHTSYLQ